MSQHRLPALNDHLVVSCARRVLGRADATITAWRIEQLHHAHEATLGVYRVHGSVQVGVADIAWSVVLKIIRADSSAGLRELHAYRSGLLTDLPGIARPYCYGADEQQDGLVWLWLEDLGDSAAQPWSIGEYQRAARDLGRF